MPGSNSRADDDCRGSAATAGITEQGRQVLVGLARGERRADIATELHVELTTVNYHVDHARETLGVANTNALVAKAFTGGLLGVDDIAGGRLDVPGLTERRREILVHLARGERHADIATALDLKSTTVGYHVSSLKQATHRATTVALIAWAFAAGILDPNSWPVIASEPLAVQHVA